MRLYLVLLAACAIQPNNPREPTVTPRGSPVADPTTMFLPAGGGSFDSADGRLTVSVPAGALAAGTSVSVQPILNMAPGGLGVAYRLGPEGASFGQPVTLTFHPGESELAQLNVESMGIAWHDADGRWRWLDRAVAGGAVSVTVNHFSDFSLVGGELLDPLTAAIKEGQSVQLEVVDCYERGSGDVTFGYDCDNSLASLEPGEWSVNGVVGGNAVLGTVTPAGSLIARYQAPAKRPSPSTVDVTVRHGNIILFSHITVGQAKDLTGTFTIGLQNLLSPVPFGVEGRATLTFADEDFEEANYEMGGTAEMRTESFTFGDAVCSLKGGEQIKTIENQSYFKVLKLPVVANRWSFVESWSYDCRSPNGEFPMDVVVQFATMSGAYCSQFADVPCVDENHPYGSFVWSCLPGMTATASWDFSPSE